MKLYHISEKNLDGQILHPRIPDNFLTTQGYEESKTVRICLCKSIDWYSIILNKEGDDIYNE